MTVALASKEAGDSSCEDINAIAVVVTHNRLDLLRECVDALRAQCLPLRRIIVVDNDSNDGTTMWLKQQRDLLTVHQENLGCAGGFERGIYEAIRLGADWVWCMDDDTVPHRDALLEFGKAACRVPRAGFFASLVTWVDGQTHKMNAPSIDSGKIEPALEEHGILPINRASFVSICVSSQAVRECGLPLGDMFLWFDDVEFTGRIARTAPCYLVSRSVAVHKTKTNVGVPDFRDATRDNYKRLAMGYRNHVVYRRQGGGTGIPMALFALSCGVKISLLYLRFGPDWGRLFWVWRGLVGTQQPYSLAAFESHQSHKGAGAR